MLFIIVIAYLLCINLVSIIVTIVDKTRAIKNKWRVRESTLFVLSLLGGSAGMYLTMQLVRHKTKKPLFMFGIPVVFVLQLLAVCLLMELI